MSTSAKQHEGNKHTQTGWNKQVQHIDEHPFGALKEKNSNFPFFKCLAAFRIKLEALILNQLLVLLQLPNKQI